MNRTAGQLTRRQEHALTALMKHGIIAQAARACGVPESTLRRWLRNDTTFIRSYRDMRRKVTEHANAILQQASAEASAKLITMMRDESLPASVRLQAIVQVLDRSASSELEERVATLEESLEAPKSERGLRAV